MYEQFFGLQKNPFVMAPDPGFLFLTASHREALAGLSYAILHRKGFVVVTGEAGTGKTTLLNAILQSIPPQRAHFSFVLNPTLTPAEFLELALLDFGINEVPASKAQRLMTLQRFLVQIHQEGKVAVLVVDEAHQLSPQLLEEIRLLTNFETPQGKLLQIVLAGQSELAETLNREDLRQLKQRIAVRLALRPLTPPEVDQYVRHRWRKAGAATELPFASEAITGVAAWSRGIPRVVNAICDNALLLAFAAGASSIGAEQIREVVADLDLRHPGNGNGRAAAVAKELSTGLLRVPEPVGSAPHEKTPIRNLQAPRPPKRGLLVRWVGRRT